LPLIVVVTVTVRRGVAGGGMIFEVGALLDVAGVLGGWEVVSELEAGCEVDELVDAVALGPPEPLPATVSEQALTTAIKAAAVINGISRMATAWPLQVRDESHTPITKVG
jgi:hypothetical protein